MKRLAVLAFALLTACATAQTPPTAGTASASTAQTLEQVTHADLQAAAARATKNGYPARAAVWTALDGLLAAQEAQAKACLAAIKAALPQPGSAPQVAGVFDGIEAAAEAVGNFQGIPANVKLLCEPLPIPKLPPLPAIPKL